MIYLIDDDEIQNLINTRVISIVSNKFPVRSFTSPKEALETLINGASPSLILLDINMPVTNGWGFLELLDEHKLSPVVYMLSSSINKQDKNKSETYSLVNGFICKPLMVDKLEEILKKEGLL
jgi:CheY-like chemotaxis protein